MIPVQRVPVPSATHVLLTRRRDNVVGNGSTSGAAREEWAKAHAAKRHVRGLLQRMASGVQRCMYCQDSLGTDIDHFQPIAAAPLRAFDWPNHLLACSHCNSNGKRDEYPCDADGACLLVDPSTENPADHLILYLESGVYAAKTPKGEETIRVFALNRSDLVRGRRAAFRMAGAAMRDWHRHLDEGSTRVAEELAEALRISPFSAVVRTMERLSPVVVSRVLDPRTAAALDEWLLRYTRRSQPAPE